MTRSELEDTRRGEHDIPGGTFDEGDKNAVSVAIREFWQETGGELLDIWPLYKRPKMKAGVLAVTHLLAGTYRLPETGIKLSDEHTESALVAPEDFSELTIPNKYKLAVRVFEPVFAQLATLSQEHSNVVSIESAPSLRLAA